MKVTGNVKYITGVTQYVVDGNDGEIINDGSKAGFRNVVLLKILVHKAVIEGFIGV